MKLHFVFRGHLTYGRPPAHVDGRRDGRTENGQSISYETGVQEYFMIGHYDAGTSCFSCMGPRQIMFPSAGRGHP